MSSAPALRPLALLTALVVLAPMLPTASALVLPDGAWSPPEGIPFTVGLSITGPQIASNGSGAVLGVGFQFVGSKANLYASFYEPGLGWGGLQLVNETGFNGAMQPAVALGDDGAAYITFVSDPVVNKTMMATRWTAATGWSPAVKLSVGSEGSQVPGVVLDGQGRAMATWNEKTGSVDHPWSSVYTPGGGWSTPVRIDAGETDPGSFAVVRASGGGTFAAAWFQGTSPDWVSMMSTYAPASGWAPDAKVCSVAGKRCIVSDLAAAPDGSATIAFYDFDAVSFARNASVRTYTPSGGLGPIHSLDDSSFVASGPFLARDEGGNVTAFWTQRFGPADGPYFARLDPAAGWGAPTLFGLAALANRVPVSVAGDGGSVTAVWIYTDAVGRTLSFARYMPGQGWSSLTAIEWRGPTTSTQLIALPGGRAILLNIAGSVAATFTFTPFDLTPPPVSITDPAAAVAVDNATMVVRGATEAGATVLVNGVAATVNATGSFEARVPLAAGANMVVAVASDAAGNSAQASVTVTFNDPVPLLAAQLAAAEASANATAQELSQLRDALAAAQANATAMRQNLSATQTDLAAAQSNLALLNASVSSKDAELAALRARVDTLDQSVANLSARSSANPPAPAGGDPLALLLAAVGVALGAAGLGAAIFVARRAKRGAAAEPRADGDPLKR
jgi:hypothetical protein